MTVRYDTRRVHREDLADALARHFLHFASITPDPYIAMVAENHRQAARDVLRWQLDHFRADVGLLDVFDPDNDPEPGQPFRTLPCQRGCAPYPHLHFVRDRLTPKTVAALDAYDRALQHRVRKYLTGQTPADVTAEVMGLLTTMTADTIERTQP